MPSLVIYGSVSMGHHPRGTAAKILQRHISPDLLFGLPYYTYMFPESKVSMQTDAAETV